MSDPEPSGAETPAAETASTSDSPPKPTLPTSTFSNIRGSGLARGKRPVSSTVQAAAAAPAADYKPTAVSILTAPTEYKNPFAPPAPTAAPAEATPADANAPTPTSIPTPATPTAETPAASVAPAPEANVDSTASGPTASVEAEAKPELKILPPEAPKRVEHSWESDSFRSVARPPAGEPGRTAEIPPAGQRPRREDHRGERPVFRPERERRDERPAEPRPSWTGPGQTGFPSAPKAAAPRKSGGLFGWVKKLFGGSSAEASKSETDARGEREFGRDGRRRRRRRGGRGRHFHDEQRGFRNGQPGGQPSGEPRGYDGEHHHHGRRRRHHGGGGYRGDSRPEGGPPAGS